MTGPGGVAKAGNVARNLLRSGVRGEMLRKARDRVLRRSVEPDRHAARRWCAEQSEDLGALLAPLDPVLWSETTTFVADFVPRAEQRLSELGLGGSGDIRLLYFLTRFLRPTTVVETGVAAGFSSSSVLRAMERNGSGHLWSSDFPYFRRADPESLIGVLVEPELRHRWTLRTRGDRVNLPEILAEAPPVDLFHFDSDKSVGGRELAIGLVQPRLTDRAVVVFDDIDDNFHFRDWAEAVGIDHHVVAYNGKYVGIGVMHGRLADLGCGS